VQELDWMNLGFGFYKRKNFIEWILALVFTSERTSLNKSWLCFLQVKKLHWINMCFGFYKCKNLSELICACLSVSRIVDQNFLRFFVVVGGAVERVALYWKKVANLSIPEASF
jgi:hypothetical protein